LPAEGKRYRPGTHAHPLDVLTSSRKEQHSSGVLPVIQWKHDAPEFLP
jgi:hypothetical protein